MHCAYRRLTGNVNAKQGHWLGFRADILAGVKAGEGIKFGSGRVGGRFLGIYILSRLDSGSGARKRLFIGDGEAIPLKGEGM
jgi:hypothetical protein